MKISGKFIIGALSVFMLASCTLTEVPSIVVPTIWEKIEELDEARLKSYFDQNSFQLVEVEGIWQYQETPGETVYTVGITKKGLRDAAEEFNIVIVSSAYSEWQYPTRIKGGLVKTSSSTVYEGFWYQRDYSKASNLFFTYDRSSGNLRTELPNGAKPILVKTYP